MKRLKTTAVAIFALLATLAFPLGEISFVAAENALMNVTISDDGEYAMHLTAADNISDLFREVGIQLGESDRVNYAAATQLWDGINISISRELEFNVQIDNETVLTRTTMPDTTVEQILMDLQQEKNVALLYDGEHSRAVNDGDSIAFASLRERLETETSAIPYQTIENRTGAVRQGFTHVRQEGMPGEHNVTTQIIYIGGEETNREVISQDVITEPVYEIIDIGTARLGALADVTSPDFHYVRRVRMEATAYTAGFSCTGKHPDDPWYRITASGREVEHGIVAVDRNVIPLGTQLYVENYGFALAADVGGAIRGYKIDLFMEEMSDALRFGRRNVYVWILE